MCMRKYLLLLEKCIFFLNNSKSNEEHFCRKNLRFLYEQFY